MGHQSHTNLFVVVFRHVASDVSLRSVHAIKGGCITYSSGIVACEISTHPTENDSEPICSEYLTVDAQGVSLESLLGCFGCRCIDQLALNYELWIDETIEC